MVKKGSGRGKAPPKDVDEYIDQLPEAARSTFERLRMAIRSAVPAGAEEVISYRIPAIRRGKILVWFAAFSDHCSLFPTASVLAAFKDELKGFKVSKGTIQFPLDQPLPIALIRRLVKARVAQLR